MYCLFKTRVIYELRDLRTIFFEEIFIMLCGIRNVTAQKYRQRFIFTPQVRYDFREQGVHNKQPGH